MHYIDCNSRCHVHVELIHILLISGSFAPGTSFVNAIHAPANGATEDQHQATEVHPISINALTNGATAIKNLQMTLSTNFNPRSSERSDDQAYDL